MHPYSLSHLSDSALRRDLPAAGFGEVGATAKFLSHIAEYDARKLYLPDGYSSMHAYCMRELPFSEQAAYKRIRIARTARQFPAILEMIADGRLHLSSVILLVPHLTQETGDELLAAAAHQSDSQLRLLLAQRFPRPDVPTQVRAIPPSPTLGAGQLSARTVELSAPARIEAPVERPKVAPLSAERFLIQVTVGKSAHDKLQYAQALFSHSIPSGNVAQLFERALDALIREGEKTVFAATETPRPRSRRSSANARYVPADVKRAVWKRDQGQCTFVGEKGQRCESRKFLEFDHVDPVARGGQATVERMRLRCRAHNQYEAERVFGAGFMSEKREQARRGAPARKRAAAGMGGQHVGPILMPESSAAAP